MSAAPLRHPRAGLTLVELILALGLFALLAVALVQLIDATLGLWQSAERERERMEIEVQVAEWLARDLDYVTGGDAGDFLFDWGQFDVDGDGVASRPLPRLRLVRRAAAEDLLRLGLRTPLDESGEVGARPRGATPLVEVVWCAVPVDVPEGAPPDGALRLLRGERLVGDSDSLSFFAPEFFSANGYPRSEDLVPIAVGVLDWRILFAGQTTVLAGGWRVGEDLRDAVLAWDARNAGRPDLEQTPLNRTHPAMPIYAGDPLLPRRLRIEFEFERPDDARRRTRLTAPFAADADELVVGEPEDLPAPGHLVLIGEEWVEIRAVRGSTAVVGRGRRGTRATAHEVGEPVRHAETVARELLVPMHREDWSL